MTSTDAPALPQSVEEIAAALDVARRLAAAGVPVFTAQPDPSSLDCGRTSHECHVVERLATSWTASISRGDRCAANACR